ncbi:MAG: DUF3054 domain-containing protein [Kineosporiaceae bacterium]
MTRLAAVSWLADLLVVVVFATLGRLSHAEALDPAGWLHTAWPFFAGLALGRAAAAALRLHPLGRRCGTLAWLTTVSCGMVLRHVAEGEGTPVSFVIVASCFLGLGLLGWRQVLIAVRRAGSARPA